MSKIETEQERAAKFEAKALEQDKMETALTASPLANYDPEMKKVEPFKWTAIKVKACYLLSLDKFSQANICEYLKINYSTLSGWKSHPDFRSRMNELILTSGHSDRPVRVKGQKKLLERLEEVLLEKLNDPFDVGEAPLSPLLGKYAELTKVISKETDGDGIRRVESGKSINVLEMLKGMDGKKKDEVIGILKSAVLAAIDEKRGNKGVIDVTPQPSQAVAPQPLAAAGKPVQSLRTVETKPPAAAEPKEVQPQGEANIPVVKESLTDRIRAIHGLKGKESEPQGVAAVDVLQGAVEAVDADYAPTVIPEQPKRAAREALAEEKRKANAARQPSQKGRKQSKKTSPLGYDTSNTMGNLMKSQKPSTDKTSLQAKEGESVASLDGFDIVMEVPTGEKASDKNPEAGK